MAVTLKDDALEITNPSITGFNPYYNGSDSKSAIAGRHYDATTHVSILIITAVTLKEEGVEQTLLLRHVSILIIMAVTLKENIIFPENF